MYFTKSLYPFNVQLPWSLLSTVAPCESLIFFSGGHSDLCRINCSCHSSYPCSVLSSFINVLGACKKTNCAISLVTRSALEKNTSFCSSVNCIYSYAWHAFSMNCEILSSFPNFIATPNSMPLCKSCLQPIMF